jgi:transposase
VRIADAAKARGLAPLACTSDRIDCQVLAELARLDEQIDACERELRRLGVDHPYIPLLTTLPGVAWVLGSTIAAEIGDSARFPSPRKLVGYTGLTPRVEQSGERDRR